VTAIASGAKRQLKWVKFSSIELAATASVEYKQGSLVGFDTSTGLLALGAASTTFHAIGTVIESVTLGAGGGSVRVKLFREVTAYWFVNATAGDAIAAGNVGAVAYVLDDQTVAANDATNTRSALGRIWQLNSGATQVLVEPIQFPVHATSSTALDN
jgi:hypothetical protein